MEEVLVYEESALLLSRHHIRGIRVRGVEDGQFSVELYGGLLMMSGTFQEDMSTKNTSGQVHMS